MTPTDPIDAEPVGDWSAGGRPAAAGSGPDADLPYILESIAECVWSAEVTATGQISYRYYSPAIERITGRAADFFMVGPERWLSIVHPADRPVLEAAIVRIVTGQLDRDAAEYRVTRLDGTSAWVRDSVVVSRPGPAGFRLHGVVHDITEAKQAEISRQADEERLRQAQAEVTQHRSTLAHALRVRSLGEMAAALAHELNQPLAAILNNARAATRFLESDPPEVAEVRASLDDIVADSRRAGEVISRLRTMMRKGETKREPVDIAHTTQEIVGLMRSEFVIRNVVVRLDQETDLPPVHADRIQIQQVLMNLLGNAVEAGASEIGVIMRTAPAGQVTVSVRDSGRGIPEDRLARLFEPFNTTKVEGLGVGLAICRNLIEAHGGRIWAANNQDVGATFSFTLPRAREVSR